MFVGKFKSGFEASGDLGTPLASNHEIAILLDKLRNKKIITDFTIYDHKNKEILTIKDYIIIPDFRIVYLTETRYVLSQGRNRGVYNKAKLFHPLIELWNKDKIKKLKQLLVLGDI